MKVQCVLLSLFCLLSTTIFCQGKVERRVDYGGFLLLGDSLQAIRAERLIDEDTFIAFSKQPNTIILDTRSVKAFEDIHIEGAKHLNFSDFTSPKLKAMIPDSSTRILIYCNNNFESKRSSLLDKSPQLALNIPTFINLIGYGYSNVYELKGYLVEADTKISLVKSNK